jgi:hypothetical protein
LDWLLLLLLLVLFFWWGRNVILLRYCESLLSGIQDIQHLNIGPYNTGI